VARSELDSGDIMVNATKREEIGYMPQVRNSVHYFLELLYGRIILREIKKKKNTHVYRYINTAFVKAGILSDGHKTSDGAEEA